MHVRTGARALAVVAALGLSAITPVTADAAPADTASPGDIVTSEPTSFHPSPASRPTPRPGR